VLNYVELARLRKVRSYLVDLSGAGAACTELDNWIAEEKYARELLRQSPPPRPMIPPKPAERMDSPPSSRPQIIEKGIK